MFSHLLPSLILLPGLVVPCFSHFADENNLDGSLPSELQVVSSLKVLSLFSNSLTGTIPWELASLRLLNTLDLNDNELTGTLPQSLFTLPLLTELSLSHNPGMKGPLPVITLAQAWSLERFRMIQSHLTGTLPSEIGLLRSIQVLELAGNELTGRLPSQVTAMTKLSSLDLSCNQLTGPVPSELLRFSSLGECGCRHSSLIIPGLTQDCA
jgi:Leucine-rich repeat (LRR) protein